MQENKDMKPEDAGEDWVILTTVANDIEYEMLAGLLATANIPSVKKVKGIDGYLQVILGFPIAGVDVLVPPDRYEDARQLTETEIEEESFEEE